MLSTLRHVSQVTCTDESTARFYNGREAEGGTLATTSNVQGSPSLKSCLKNMSGMDDRGGIRERRVPTSRWLITIIPSAHITIATVSVTGHDVLCKDFREIKQHENTVSVLPCIPENSNTQISSLGSLAYSYSASGPSLQARVASNVEPPFNR